MSKDFDDRVLGILHEVWLRIHTERFDDTAVNSFYSGVLRAEKVVADVAADYGISWRELRQTQPRPTRPGGAQ